MNNILQDVIKNSKQGFTGAYIDVVRTGGDTDTIGIIMFCIMLTILVIKCIQLSILFNKWRKLNNLAKTVKAP